MSPSGQSSPPIKPQDTITKIPENKVVAAFAKSLEGLDLEPLTEQVINGERQRMEAVGIRDVEVRGMISDSISSKIAGLRKKPDTLTPDREVFLKGVIDGSRVKFVGTLEDLEKKKAKRIKLNADAIGALTDLLSEESYFEMAESSADQNLDFEIDFTPEMQAVIDSFPLMHRPLITQKIKLWYTIVLKKIQNDSHNYNSVDDAMFNIYDSARIFAKHDIDTTLPGTQARKSIVNLGLKAVKNIASSFRAK